LQYSIPIPGQKSIANANTNNSVKNIAIINTNTFSNTLGQVIKHVKTYAYLRHPEMGGAVAVIITNLTFSANVPHFKNC